MAYVGFPYMAGLFFASFFSVKANFVFLIGIATISVIYLLLFKKYKKEAMVIAISFCIAVLANIIYTQNIYNNIMKYNGKIAIIQGEIESIKYLEGNKAIYQIKGKIDGKVKTTVLLYSQKQAVECYDNVKVKATFSKLENSFSFPSENYYKPKSIYLEASEPELFEQVGSNSFSIKKPLRKYSGYIFNKITTILPKEEGSFLGALLCGDTSEISSSTKQTLFRAGIGHIISVSGSHLMIIAGLLFLALKRLPLSKCTRFAILEAVVIAFTIFSGMSVSVIRAGIMFTVLILGDLAKRRADPLNSIALAGLILTIFNPYAIRDASLLLSLSGVFGLTVFSPYILSYFDVKGRFVALKKSLAAMVCVSVCTFPFIVMFFDEVSIISPIGNLILAPLCSFALLCCLIIAFTGGIPFLAYPLLLLAGLAIKLLILISELLIKIPFAYIPLGYNFIIIALSVCFIGILAITYIYRTKRVFIVTIMASVLIMLVSGSIINFDNRSKLDVAIISENNSSAMVLNKNGQACIIDISGFGEISDTVNKYLIKKGIKSVEVVFLNGNYQKSSSAYINSISKKINSISFGDNQTTILPYGIKAINLSNGSTAKLSDFEVKLTDSGYMITYDNFKCLISIDNSNNNLNGESVSVNVKGDVTELTTNDNQKMLFNNKQSFAVNIKAQKNGKFSMRRMNYALR